MASQIQTPNICQVQITNFSTSGGLTSTGRALSRAHPPDFLQGFSLSRLPTGAVRGAHAFSLFTQDDVIFVQIFACKQRFLEVNYLYGRFSAHLRSRCRYTLHSPEWEIPRPTNICQPDGHQDVVVAHDFSRLILSTLFDIMQRYITNF